jgi:zinc transport system permease protein
MAVGFAVSLVGVALSYYADTPSGGTIVLLAIAVFGVTVIAQSASRLTRR